LSKAAKNALISSSPYDLSSLLFNFNKIFPASSTEIVPLPSTSINEKIFSIEPELTEAPDEVPIDPPDSYEPPIDVFLVEATDIVLADEDEDDDDDELDDDDEDEDDDDDELETAEDLWLDLTFETFL